MFKTIDYVQKAMTIGQDPPSDDANKHSGKLNVSITKTNDDFNPTQAQIQERVKYIKRGHESAIMNDTTKSSMVIRHDGQINLSSNRYTQYKLNPSGKIIESSLESVSLSNRYKIQTDDMVLNEHKLNPYLYELTDMKKLASAYNNDMIVGNFCLFGSVLTKSWEMNLKRYVLMRRPARMPMFSTVLNVPEINTGLGVTDPLKIDEDLLAKSTKGYQVHDVVSDANSLIGKEGRARAGSNSGNIISYGDTGAAGSAGGTSSNGSPATGLPDINTAGANDSVPDTKVPESIPYGNIANMVGQIAGIKPRFVWAQMYHETGGWPSDYWGIQYHNYSGIKGAGGPVSSEGDTYKAYSSDEEYAQDYAKELKLHAEYQQNERGVKPITQAQTPLEYAYALRESDYYMEGKNSTRAQAIEEYVNGMCNALKKIPATSS